MPRISVDLHGQTVESALATVESGIRSLPEVRLTAGQGHAQLALAGSVVVAVAEAIACGVIARAPIRLFVFVIDL